MLIFTSASQKKLSITVLYFSKISSRHAHKTPKRPKIENITALSRIPTASYTSRTSSPAHAHSSSFIGSHWNVIIVSVFKSFPALNCNPISFTAAVCSLAKTNALLPSPRAGTTTRIHTPVFREKEE